MKSFFSKVLGISLTVLIVVSTIFFNGCAETEQSIALFPEAEKGNYPQKMDITYPGFFYPTNYNRYDTYDAENGSQWLENISTRYGVELNVSTNANDANGTIRSLLTGGRTAEVVSGFVYMNASNLVSMYGNPQNILPLERYLEKNPVWKSLPQKVRDAFTVDGHIWAIPYSYISLSPQIRAYDSDVLAAAGMEAPTTLDEFTEFSQKVSTLQKSGGTDVKDIVPMCSFANYCAADILRAYGIYSTVNGMLCYDPIEDCIADGFLKPEAEQALGYLRDLYLKGGLNMTDYIGTSTGLYQNAIGAQTNYATAYYSSYTTALAYLGALDKYSCVTEMNRGQITNPQVLDTSFAGYVLAASTPEPEKCVNFLLDLFFGSKYNYYETRYGSERNYTISSDGTISINLKEDGSYPTLPYLLGRIEGLEMGDEYSGYNQQYGSSTFQYNIGVKLNALRTEALQNGTAIEVPVVCQYAMQFSRWYTGDLMQEVVLATNDCFVNAITDDTRTVKEVLDKYRVVMRDLGAQHLLDDANAVIGKSGIQKY